MAKLRTIKIGLLSALAALAFASTALGDASSFARRHHFYLIGGYLNEAIPGYFDENVARLRALGATHITVIMPRSENTILENVPLIAEQVLRGHGESGLPGVVVAHSKGGLEFFQTLVRHAGDFPAQVIERVFIVQAPLLGSVATDVMFGSGDALLGWNPAYWLLRSQYRVAGRWRLRTSRVPSSKPRPS